jgi:hypothetical protein
MQKRLNPAPFLVLAFSLVTGCARTQTTSQGPTGPPGPAGIIFMNAFNPVAPYVSTDVVTYQGSSYIAIAPSTNIAPVGVPTSQSTWALLAEAGVAGAQGVQGPMGPTGPLGIPGTAGTPGTTSISFLQNRRFAVQGDSISSITGNLWQKTVSARTGMSFASQDARPGRKFETAFECYGNPAVGGTPLTFNTGYVIPLIGGTCGIFSLGAKDGNTLAQNLASVDVLIVQLGSNDNATTPMGQLGDSVSAGTFFGNMRWVVETYLTTKPSIRLILVTPQYMNNVPSAITVQYVNAMVAYGQSIGIPVINMFALGGVNALTYKTLLNGDVHPSEFGLNNNYGPVIAQAVQQLY